jgi:hypothetical protein
MRTPVTWFAGISGKAATCRFARKTGPIRLHIFSPGYREEAWGRVFLFASCSSLAGSSRYDKIPQARRSIAPSAVPARSRRAHRPS